MSILGTMVIAGDHGGTALHGHDVPGPARGLPPAGQDAVIALQLAERVRTGSQVRVRAWAAPRFGNQRRHGRAAGLETGRFLPFRTEKRIDGAVLTVEDIDLVMAIGLGEKYAELGVREVEIDGLVRDLE